MAIDCILIKDFQFDSFPTSGSNNIMTSGNIYKALSQKLGKDETVTNAEFANMANSAFQADRADRLTNYITLQTNLGMSPLPKDFAGDMDTTIGVTGTLPITNGGTGTTSLPSGLLVGSGTSAISARTITNNTSTATAISGSTNIPTMNTLKYALDRTTNRTTDITSADTNYGTVMLRGIQASTTNLISGTSTLTSGVLYLVYEQV